MSPSAATAGSPLTPPAGSWQGPARPAPTRCLFPALACKTGPMSYKPERRWVNSGQPQTLQASVILLYLNAIFFVIFGGLSGGFGLIGLAMAAVEGVGGYGIANERKWGWSLVSEATSSTCSSTSP